MKPEYPKQGELVVCKIKRVVDYGAFVDLQEYEKEGFIHVSNIASGWVKNIRSHVSEGQLRVASVVRVDKHKDLIDASLRKVSPKQEKRKLSEWKRTKRAEKLFERACKKLELDVAEQMEKVGSQLESEFGDLYSAFETMSTEGEASISKLKIPKELAVELIQLSKDSITPPSVTIRGTLNIKIFNDDGLSVIKSIAKAVTEKGAEINYLSAPEYSLSITSTDYETAEKILEDSVKEAESIAGKNGEVTFERQQK